MSQSGVAFGTSGARGLVESMTDRLCYGYTQGFLRYLQQRGEYSLGGPVAIAGDLRPSTPRIKAACAAAVLDLGGTVWDAGFVPSPALAAWSFARGVPSLMVTGSHIPDDRNGIKFNCPRGELLKSDEPGIRAQRISIPEGRFSADGALLLERPASQTVDVLSDYKSRYLGVWNEDALRGLKVGVYQHSAVGRDVLTEILELLGATVVPLGRADTFIPVDTEAIRPEDVELAAHWTQVHALDALVSTDGDSDRPLLADERGLWWRGDVLGVICARSLAASTVVTPVSSNTALERSGWFARTYRTRIGSPYVVEAMQQALSNGETSVCGYEANGGFLLMDDFSINGKRLAGLPTRDAVLPILSVLTQAVHRGTKVSDLLGELPSRYTHSDRVPNMMLETSQRELGLLLDPMEGRKRIDALLGGLCGALVNVDSTDGVRLTFERGDVVHLRPSGNAPELRCYIESETEEGARTLADSVMQLIGRWGSKEPARHVS